MPNGVLLNVGGLADELLAPASFDDDDTASHTTLGIDPSSFAIAMTGADGIYVKIPYAYQSTTAIQYALANIRHPTKLGDKAIVTHGVHRGRHVKVEGFTTDGKKAFVTVERTLGADRRPRGLFESNHGRLRRRRDDGRSPAWV